MWFKIYRALYRISEYTFPGFRPRFVKFSERCGVPTSKMLVVMSFGNSTFS